MECWSIQQVPYKLNKPKGEIKMSNHEIMKVFFLVEAQQDICVLVVTDGSCGLASVSCKLYVKIHQNIGRVSVQPVEM